MILLYRRGFSTRKRNEWPERIVMSFMISCAFGGVVVGFMIAAHWRQ